MKDRHAVTLQWITIKCKDDRSAAIDADDLRVVRATRHARGLRLGQLTGNRFIIRIRQLDPTAAPRLMQRLTALARSGLPNRFMSQRFGYRGANQLLGGRLLRKDWSGALRCWLGTEGPEWPEAETPRRAQFNRGEFNAAASAWPVSWKAERQALRQLAEGGSPDQVLAEVPRSMKRLWTDAFQSAIFNDVLDRRAAEGTIASLADGDVSWSHERLLSEIDAAGPSEVPTGPLWGRRMRRAAGGVDHAEVQALRAAGLSLDMIGAPGMPRGNRRPLLVPVGAPRCESGFDDHGGYVEVGFELGKGSYATAVVDALIRPDAT
jgi:tRNA pseudouridine13 synthase